MSEKDKILVTSVFYTIKDKFHDLPSANAFNLEQAKIMSIGRELTHSLTMTPLTPLGNKPFENSVGKGEIARNEQFLLFPQCFLPVWITFFRFRQI